MELNQGLQDFSDDHNQDYGMRISPSTPHHTIEQDHLTGLYRNMMERE